MQTPDAPAPTQIELVDVPAPVTPPPAAAVKVPARVVKKAVPAPVVKPEVAQSAVPVTAPQERVDQAPLQTSPRVSTLVPRESAVALPAPEEPESKGQTVHNRPEELPDPEAMLAFEAERVHDRVDGWAQKTLARTRVENGVVPYYFHDLRHRLEKLTSEPPPFAEPFGLKSLPEHGKQAINGWSTAAKAYGKTGAAYQAPDGYKELHGVAKSELEKGGTQAMRFNATVSAGEHLREFGNGRMGEELIAVVEVKQGSNGALVDLSLLQPSSSVRFDAWVMQQAPKAVDGRVSPPDAGVGIHADGMRSVWAFKGRVTYKRDLKDAKLLEDGWYVGLMAIPGLLTGNFDEVTGKVEYIDLRHPRYECSVQLLEVY